MSVDIKKYKCDKCGNMFSAKGGNYNTHINSCNGVYTRFQKITNCKWCDLSFGESSSSQIANHTRWCEKNPKFNEYRENTSTMRLGITKESRKKQSDGVKKAHISGKYVGAGIKAAETRKQKGNYFHTDETKAVLREKALNSKHRRLVRSIREYTKTDGTIVILDSSWEEALAKRLDHLGVNWIRPTEPLSYILDGVQRNYFPDFYLVDYDIFLDPKNPYALKVQKEKIDIVCKMMKNLKILYTLEECQNFIL